MAAHGAGIHAVAVVQVGPARAVAVLSGRHVPIVVATRRELALHRGGGGVSNAGRRVTASEDVALLPDGRILVAISTCRCPATARAAVAAVVAIAHGRIA